jgi:hypothetical protein
MFGTRHGGGLCGGAEAPIACDNCVQLLHCARKHTLQAAGERRERGARAELIKWVFLFVHVSVIASVHVRVSERERERERERDGEELQRENNKRELKLGERICLSQSRASLTEESPVGLQDWVPWRRCCALRTRL